MTRACARCGERRDLYSDGTCWLCAIEYRDELIAEYRTASADLDRLRAVERAARKYLDAPGRDIQSERNALRAALGDRAAEPYWSDPNFGESGEVEPDGRFALGDRADD